MSTLHPDIERLIDTVSTRDSAAAEALAKLLALVERGDAASRTAHGAAQRSAERMEALENEVGTLRNLVECLAEELTKLQGDPRLLDFTHGMTALPPLGRRLDRTA